MKRAHNLIINDSPAQIVTPPPPCFRLILLYGFVPLSSQPLIQPSGPSRVARDFASEQNISEIGFHAWLSPVQACQLMSLFQWWFNSWLKFVTFPMLLKILHRPALDLDGTPASWNILALVEWGFFDNVFFTVLISLRLREIFRNFPLSALPSLYYYFP